MAFPRSGGFNKRAGGFKGGGSRFGNKRGFDRGARAGGRPDMHPASCAHCHKPCEVPFKPDGSRPIYCRDCFGENKPEQSERSFERAPREYARPERRSFERGSDRRDAAPQANTPVIDMRPIMDAAREMRALTEKVQSLIDMLATQGTPSSAASKSAADKPATSTKKAAKKK